MPLERQVETTSLPASAGAAFCQELSPKSQLEQATLTYDQAVATRDLPARRLDQAKNQVGYTDLKADKDGIVTAVNADVGQWSAPARRWSPSRSTVKRVLIAVPEMEIAEFKPGKLVKADSGPTTR